MSRAFTLPGRRPITRMDFIVSTTLSIGRGTMEHGKLFADVPTRGVQAALDLRFFENGESDVAMAAVAGSFKVDFASPD